MTPRAPADPGSATGRAQRTVRSLASDLISRPSTVAGRTLGLVATATAVPVCLMSWVARNSAVDTLTGLPNRRGADPVLAAALAAADRTGAPAALAVVDVDGFGAVNAERGWSCGDELLVLLARQMSEHLPASAHLSRKGGDTFLVLLPGAPASGGATATAVLDAALGSLSHPATAGVAVRDDGEGPADLVRRATSALAHAKRHARGRSHLAAPGTSELARDLSAALADPAGRGLHVQLQPVVDVATGAVVGVEALARWSDPRRGAVSPADFVPAAEGGGLIRALGAVVVRAACREVAPLRARWGDGVFLAVNASGHELVGSGYVDGLLAALDEERLPPTALVVEVTESVLDGGSPAAVAALRRLRERGVRVAVDDFGAGYSSLTRLDEVPADFLKLDATLLATAPHSPRRRVLLATAVALAQELGLSAIAEGAETPEHAALLAELGCPLVQGFGYARPASSSELLAAGRLRPAEPAVTAGA